MYRLYNIIVLSVVYLTLGNMRDSHLFYPLLPVDGVISGQEYFYLTRITVFTISTIYYTDKSWKNEGYGHSASVGGK